MVRSSRCHWDSPELCEAALSSAKFVIGYWPDLSTLEETLKDRLHDFLKCIFTDEIEHRDIDTIMAETKTYGLFVSGYQIDDEDLDIFSYLVF